MGYNITYSQLDESARQEAKINREGGGTGETFLDALQMVLEDLEPLNERMRAFPTTWIQVKGRTAKFVSPEPWKATPVDNYTDLRKLKTLGIDSMLPFKRLSGLNVQWNRTQPLERVKFLSKFQSPNRFTSHDAWSWLSRSSRRPCGGR